MWARRDAALVEQTRIACVTHSTAVSPTCIVLSSLLFVAECLVAQERYNYPPFVPLSLKMDVVGQAAKPFPNHPCCTVSFLSENVVAQASGRSGPARERRDDEDERVFPGPAGEVTTDSNSVPCTFVSCCYARSPLENGRHTLLYIGRLLFPIFLFIFFCQEDPATASRTTDAV